MTQAFLTTRGGLRLHYREGGNPDGPPLLLLHGYTDSSWCASRVVPYLGASHRMIALDQRGHGDSDRAATDYRLETMAADALDALDELEVPTAIVMGHCMGGMVAQRLAAQEPERVSALVLIDSAASAHTPAVLELARDVEALGDTVDPEFVRAFQQSTIHRPVPEEFLAGVVRESLKLPAATWKAVMRALLAAERVDLHAVRCPVLLVWGQHDAVFGPADQHELTAQLPHARVVRMDGIGHSPHWEAPDEFADRVRWFLATMPQPSSFVPQRSRIPDRRNRTATARER